MLYLSKTVSWAESYKESEDRDSPTEDGEVDGPPKKVAEIKIDAIDDSDNDVKIE